MTFTSNSLICAAAALLVTLPCAASAQDGTRYFARNDSTRALTCGVRRAGSSAIDSFTIRAGETWSGSYSGAKARLIKCEGMLSRWQQMAPGQTYRLVASDDEQIIAQPLPR